MKMVTAMAERMPALSPMRRLSAPSSGPKVDSEMGSGTSLACRLPPERTRTTYLMSSCENLPVIWPVELISLLRLGAV